MKLLHIDSSILGQGSVSRALSADVVAAQRASRTDIEVTYRDLATDPIGHLTGTHLAAAQGAAPADAAIRRDIAAGQAALDEFLAADVLVVGAPMYNFGVASQLKAWIDRIAVAGKTFVDGCLNPGKSGDIRLWRRGTASRTSASCVPKGSLWVPRHARRRSRPPGAKCSNSPRKRRRSSQAIVSTTPPSTRSAAPVVAEACGEAA
jgi:NAD(P)H-dependent FMN reductase